MSNAAAAVALLPNQGAYIHFNKNTVILGNGNDNGNAENL